MLRMLFLIPLLGLSLSSCTNASHEPLDERILSSSVVFIGVVEGVSDKPIVPDFFGDLRLATLKVEKIFGSELGIIEVEKPVFVPFRQHMSHWVDFQVGQRYLVFLAFCATGPQIVGTMGGAVRQADLNSLLLPNGKSVDAELFERMVARLFSEELGSERAKLRDLGCGKNGDQI